MADPLVCVSLEGTTVKEMLDEAARAGIAGADMIEVRFDRLYLSRQLQIMMEENEPLVVNFQLDNVNITEKIYYRDSDLLTKLQYYPFALLLLIGFGFLNYKRKKTNPTAYLCP